MSKLDETNQIIDFSTKLLENNFFDPKLLTVTFLMDMAKSLAMIADFMTEEEAKKKEYEDE